jgi:hypothetical protein
MIGPVPQNQDNYTFHSEFERNRAAASGLRHFEFTPLPGAPVVYRTQFPTHETTSALLCTNILSFVQPYISQQPIRYILKIIIHLDHVFSTGQCAPGNGLRNETPVSGVLRRPVP